MELLSSKRGSSCRIEQINSKTFWGKWFF